MNGACFQPGISPGSWMTIDGNNLSSKTDSWNNSIVKGALPTTLDGVSVMVGSQPAYIEYVSSGQINAVAPGLIAGIVPVTVTTSNGTSSAVNAQLSHDLQHRHGRKRHRGQSARHSVRRRPRPRLRRLVAAEHSQTRGPTAPLGKSADRALGGLPDQGKAPSSIYDQRRILNVID